VVATTAAEALQSASSIPHPDLVLVDVVLPDLSGIEVVRRLRSFSAVPIVLVTSRREVADKVVALDAGADDYVSKPFEPAELLARVRAQLRRQQESPASSRATVLTVGPLAIDTAAHRVTVAGTPVHVSPREFAILQLLAETAGQVIGRRELFARVWGRDFFGDEGAVDVYMRRLRAKIEPEPSRPRYLHTVRGTGFRLADESSVHS
jgi:two-component system, OmpR family, response regulator RegX3